MCFYIYPNALEITKGLRKLKEPIIVYKILNHDMSSYLSPESYQWKYGLNISSRRTKKPKKTAQTINKGFYFYRLFHDANYTRAKREDLRIFKCLVDPKDIVISSICILVATKAILVE